VINVVNRHKDEAIATDIRSIVGTFAPTASVSLVANDDISDAPYTYAARDTYPPKVEQIATQGASLRYSFPAHSFTQIVVGINR